MRGDQDAQDDVWSYIPLEQRVPAEHPLRPLRAMVDAVLKELSPQFAPLYSRVGRPSIPPEYLLRALLLQILYSVRSERLLMEQLDYNLLFRWFVGLKADDRIWDATVFTKNRQRLLDGNIAQAFFERVVALVAHWADQLGLPEAERTRWLRAAWLHDALRDAPEAELRRLAPDEPGPTDLLHGPAAAVRARQDGEDDAGVLGAVHWHSLGSAHWDRAGQALYCADFLEPGRKFDREERATLAARFPRGQPGAQPAARASSALRRRITSVTVDARLSLSSMILSSTG